MNLYIQNIAFFSLLWENIINIQIRIPSAKTQELTIGNDKKRKGKEKLRWPEITGVRLFPQIKVHALKTCQYSEKTADSPLL